MNEPIRFTAKMKGAMDVARMLRRYPGITVIGTVAMAGAFVLTMVSLADYLVRHRDVLTRPAAR